MRWAHYLRPRRVRSTLSARRALRIIAFLRRSGLLIGLLKRWLALPLKDVSKINSRHEVVSYLKDNPDILKSIQTQIKQISDLERLISKIADGKVSPREVIY